jgi:acyl-CoA reductase-like NAD-dependent aldehyde dehydrogenase
LRLFASQANVKQLYTSHEINYVVFMGSLESAHDVYTEVAQNDFIDVQLDLGGKDAAYVAPDCDMELTL